MASGSLIPPAPGSALRAPSAGALEETLKFASRGMICSVITPASPRGKNTTTAMNRPPIANSHSCGNCSENMVLAQFTSSVPATAPTTELRPPTAQKITISIEGTMPTKDGDMNPTCRVNIAPPTAAIAEARQNTKIL